MGRRRPARRGVVLLIVLSLIVLFMLLIVTMIVAAGHYRTAAVATSRFRRTEDDGRRLAETALYQLLRDVPSTFSSSLRDHSLLGDLYGADGVAATVSTAYVDTATDGSLLVVGVRPEPGSNLSRAEDYYNGRVVTFVSGTLSGYSSRVLNYTLSPGPDGQWGHAGVNDDGIGPTDDKAEALGFNGTSITMTDDLGVLVLDITETQRNTTTLANLPSSGDRVVINGAPFNGGGFGYNPDSGVMDADAYLPGMDGQWGEAGTDDDGNGVVDDISEAGWPGSDDVALGAPGAGFAALFSHRSTPAISGLVGTAAVLNGPLLGRLTLDAGGADESWDAADFQNMFLAQVPPDSSFPGLLLPSFHRPDLIRYLFCALYNNSNSIANLGSAPGTGSAHLAAAWNAFVRPDLAGWLPVAERQNLIALKRACIFRPLPENHPNFTGSNPNFHYFGSAGWIENLDSALSHAEEVAAIGSGVFDVDNDGDQIRDSIWMDIGLPVQTAVDGRRYRPLVAILCKDLDGRLNLNAVGSIEAHPTSLTNTFRFHPGPDGAWGRYGIDDDGNSVIDDASEAGASLSDDRSIGGISSSYGLPRGYGVGPAEISLTPLYPANAAQHLSILTERYHDKVTGTKVAGIADGSDDIRSYYENPLLPTTYAALQARGYATPPDTRGLGSLMLDYAGQPRTAYRGITGEPIDDPYENVLDILRPMGTGSRIQQYSLSDMELLLRRYDSDSARLPRRLLNVASTTDSVRNMVTVHSSHLPVPNTAVARFLRDNLSAHSSNASSLFADIRRASPTLIDAYRTKLLENGITDLTQIERQLSIIAPFEFRRGQLLNVNRAFGNGLDDNNNGAIDDFAESQLAWPSLANTDPFYGIDYEGRNDDPLNPYSRIIFARHLYCLMMLVTDEAYAWSDADGAVTANERARRIAQWAVNVVDFRDPDAIMTPFEYDVNPFNGWSVDGDIRTDEATDGNDNDGDGTVDAGSELERRVIWGCEYPDLLISETLAFHDRRIKDTDQDDGNSKYRHKDNPADENDEDPDQYRIPEGSLFVEVQCTRSGYQVNPALPNELYSFDRDPMTGQILNAYLDLGRLSPERGGVRYPVWRLAVGPEVPTAPAGAEAVGNAFKEGMPAGTSALNDLESGVFQLASSQIERVVWFSPAQAAFQASVDNARGFYARTGSLKPSAGAGIPQESTVALYPGQYAVVGPRPTTYIGSAVDTSDPTNISNSPQSITISPTVSANATMNGNNAPVSYPVANTLPVTGIVCAAHPPTTWTNAANLARLIGMNVSEPMPQAGNYYAEPKTGSPTMDGYFDPSQPVVTDPADPNYNAYPDVPFDQDGNGPGRLGNAWLQTGTNLDFKSLYLQRLADPTLPWNPDPNDDAEGQYNSSFPVNPYIVVDWARVDLTVFSGEENTNRQVDTDGDSMNDEWVDPVDQDPFSSDPPELFRSRPRNGAKYNIWSPRSLDPAATTSNDFPGADPRPYFRRMLRHSLGYLNHTYGSPTTRGSYVGIPSVPTPWMAWLNRPFASPYEMLLVPSSSPDRLLFETISAGTVQDLNDTGDWNEHPFWPNMTGMSPYDETNANNFRAPFAQLLNFFHSSSTNAPDTLTDGAAHFYRIFDFVEVSSPFVGTQKWLDARAFKTETTTNAMGVTVISNPLASEYRPPFNHISTFRDPGRINLNTAPLGFSFGPDGEPGVAGADDDGNGTTDDLRELFATGSDDQYYGQIWEALAKNYPFMDPTVEWLPGPDGAWGEAGVDDDGDGTTDNFSERGRHDDVRGFGTFLSLIASLRGRTASAEARDYPTIIANPLRSALSADLMPDIPGLRRSGVDVGLLRSRPGTTPPAPLFVANNLSYNSNTGTAYLASDRNPYFYYQGLSRLGNLVTAHSNVYAIWITVGYFEIEDTTVSVAHPDGLRLGQELGLDIGSVVRHRSFFVVDRSVPVAFERGRNHNIDRMILLKRSLE